MRTFLLLLVFLTRFPFNVALAENFTISRNQGEKDDILIMSPKINDHNEMLEYSSSVATLITSKLNSTNFFNVVEESSPKFMSMLERNRQTDVQKDQTLIPRESSTLIMQVAQKMGINYTIDLTFDEVYGIKYLRYDLWDNLSENKIQTNYFAVSENSPEKLAKYIAHSVHLSITQEFGFLIGKSVISSRPQDGYQALMSFDGVRYKSITDDRNMITTPRLCQNGDKIFFAMRYVNERFGQIFSIGGNALNAIYLPEFANISLSSPAISRDCKILAFTASYNGKSSIFMSDLVKRESYSVINNGVINTYPRFDAVLDKVFYISDVGGSPKIWVIDVDGSNARMISRGFGSYLAYDVSDTKIVFVKVLDGKFVLGTMDLDGKHEKILQKASFIEAPVFAPVGNNIVVSMRMKSQDNLKLYSVSSFTGSAYEIFPELTAKTRHGVINALWFIDDAEIPKDITDSILNANGGAHNLLQNI